MPKGTVKQMPPWESKIFAGTKRDWWVYVPAQYRPETPAAVMVFQDGGGSEGLRADRVRQPDRQGRHAGDGRHLHPARARSSDGRANRSFEYDTLSDQYARFLLEEILPEVEKTVKLRHDAASRAIAGASSGGICAFTVAWERPDRVQQGALVGRQLHQHRQRQDHARGRPQLRGDDPQDAEEADPRVPPGRRQRPRQRQRQLAARQPDDGEVARVRADTTTTSSSARASTATATAAPSCPTRCAGSGAGTGREVLSY